MILCHFQSRCQNNLITSKGFMIKQQYLWIFSTSCAFPSILLASNKISPWDSSKEKPEKSVAHLFVIQLVNRGDFKSTHNWKRNTIKTNCPSTFRHKINYAIRNAAKAVEKGISVIFEWILWLGRVYFHFGHIFKSNTKTSHTCRCRYVLYLHMRNVNRKRRCSGNRILK